MHRRLTWLSVAAALLCLAVWIMVGSSSRGAGLLTLAMLPNPANLAPSQVTFRITNNGAHSVFLSELVVEVQTPGGLQIITNSTPSDPRNLDGGKTKDFVVAAPSGSGAWRVRIAYGDEVRYPELFLLKAGLALGSRTMGPFKRLRPGDTWMGSNSLSSPVLTN